MKRICITLMVFMILFSIGIPVTVCATEAEKNTVTIEDLKVDKSNESFSFVVNVDSDHPYAGAEFGAFCSQGVKITSVKSSAGSVAGPTKANGLDWFSFFDGANSFNGTQSVTVYGSYELGQESAVKLSDIKIYSTKADEYITTSVDDDVNVQISKGSVKLSEVAEDGYINIILFVALLLVIVATTIIIFIYIKSRLKRRKGEMIENV